MLHLRKARQKNDRRVVTGTVNCLCDPLNCEDMDHVICGVVQSESTKGSHVIVKLPCYTSLLV